MVMFCFDFLFCFLTSKYTDKNIGRKENPAEKRKRPGIKNIHYKPSVFCKEPIPLSRKRQPVVNMDLESPSGENII